MTTILRLRFRLRLRLRLRLRYKASMTISLVIDVALLTVVPVVSLFPPNDFDFSGRCHWIRFLLFVIS